MYTLSTGTAEPIQCPIGTYRTSVRGQTESDCSNCTGGWFCNETGLTMPAGECDPGYYCPSKSSSKTEHDCTEGHYCPQTTEYPVECPKGHFSSSTRLSNSSDCQKCTPGFYCGATSLTTPSGPCTAGYYCPLGSISDKSQKCPAGMHCPTGSAQPKHCWNGNYSNSELRGDCLTCPPGSYCVSSTVTAGKSKKGCFVY